MNFNAAADAQELETRADRRMFDCFVAANIFDLRVRYPAVVLEERRKPPGRDVATLVNGRRQHSATVLAIPDRVIRASAEERYPKWCTGDDHFSKLDFVGVQDR